MSKQEDAQVHQQHPRSLSDKDVLEAIDREIAFYRSRLDWLFTYTLAAQILTVTGQQTISLKEPVLGKIIYTGFFAIIGFLSTLLRNSYRCRVYRIRQRRNELLKKSSYENIYHEPGGGMEEGKHSLSPSLIYLICVWTLSVTGIAIIWFGK